MTSLNLLAADKSIYKFMRGPKDWSCVGVDINALEPHTIAHFSQCPVYMSLYGPDAAPNQDAYIHLGCTIPKYAELFLPHYKVGEPTKEGVDYIKDNYDQERFVCKVTFLSSVYGIFPPALRALLLAGGVDMSIREVEGIHQSYWRTFAAVKTLTHQLQEEWRRNGGFVVSGRGTPKPMDNQAASKDILSRFIQTTGHQYVMRWLFHINEIKQERKVTMRPIIKDLHDATYWTAPDDQIEEAGKVIQDGLTRLNEELNLSVVFKGKTKIGKTLEIAK